MIVTDVDLLKRLQSWYLSQCNGCWEHTYGISITTLDNPGWRLKVDLTDANLSNRTFDEINFEGKDKNDWYQCRVKNGDFEGHCGPARLSDVIAIFLDWADGID
jgi:hypothetical protein